LEDVRPSGSIREVSWLQEILLFTPGWGPGKIAKRTKSRQQHGGKRRARL